MSIQTDKQKEIIKFFIYGKAFVIKKLSKKSSLSSVRNELTKQNNIDFVFMLKEGFIVEKQEENDFSLYDISDRNEVYLKSKNDNLLNNKQPDEKVKNIYKKEDINYKIIETLNEEIYNYKNDSNIQALNKPPANIFIINEIKKEKEKEKVPIIEDKNKKDNSLNMINIDAKITPRETPSFGITEAVKVKIFVNGKYKFDCEMDKNWNLPKVREKLSNLIKNDFLFLLPDGFIINHIEEEIFSLEGILNEDKIYINQVKLMHEININNNKINSDIYDKKIPLKNCDNNIIYNKNELNKETKLINNIDNKNINDIPNDRYINMLVS